MSLAAGEGGVGCVRGHGEVGAACSTGGLRGQGRDTNGQGGGGGRVGVWNISSGGVVTGDSVQGPFRIGVVDGVMWGDVWGDVLTH